MNADDLAVPLRKFLSLTFALSWAIWIPLVLSRPGIGLFPLPDAAVQLLSFLGVLMPALAALLLAARAGTARALLSRLVLWRVGWPWWAAALGPAGLLLFTALVYRLVYGELPVDWVRSASAGGLAVTLVFLLLATLGEEIGWRGLALPALILQHGAWKASLILGLVYMAWHTPYWLIVGTLDRAGLTAIGLNYLFAFPLTFYLTWFFVGGRFSLLLPVAFHLSFNILNTAVLPVTANLTAYGMFIAFVWAAALLVIPSLRSAPGARNSA
jgi:hypothetical protein